MRRNLKKDIIAVFSTLYEAHEVVNRLIKNKDFYSAHILLSDCQETAFKIGTMLEDTEGIDTDTVRFLEHYCDVVYECAVKISNGLTTEFLKSEMDKALKSAENRFSVEFEVKLEIVFMPYKASMWDSLESVWQAANENPLCNVYVIPIPYYGRDTNGNFESFHYEGDLFPEYVPITNYEEYSISDRRPDIVYIHNPYDGYNFVTSVEPRFYSTELKKYVDQLVYIPYFVLPKSRAPEFANTAGVLVSDKVFVQSRKMREDYIYNLSDKIPRDILEKKIIAIGSPKIEKMEKNLNLDIELPNEWKEKLDGRKVIFFNTNVSLILNNSDGFIKNMQRIFSIFKQYSDEYVVIWREHPLSMETLVSMRPHLVQEYLTLRKQFLDEEVGIIDETPDAYRALKISDCYFGAGGSLTVVYAVTGKPMLVTAYNYPDEISDVNITVEKLMDSIGPRTYYNEKNANTLNLFLENLELLSVQREQRLDNLNALVENVGNNVGKKINDYMVQLLINNEE